MKIKLYFIAIFLFAGIYAVQAQVKGEVKFKMKDIKIIKENGFDRFFSEENFYIEDLGSPALPVLFKSYLIPIDADNVTVNIQNISKQKETGQYVVYPAQHPIYVGSKDTCFVNPNPKIYDTNNMFPDKLAEIVSDDKYLGYRIVTVRLYPIEYSPKAKELYICNFNFTIDYVTNTKQGKGNDEVMQTQSLYRYELNKKSVKSRVENPEAADTYDTKVQKVIQGRAVVYDFSATSNEATGLFRSQSVSVTNERIPDYIIITSDSLKAAFQTLADWKTKKGIFTVTATTEEINTKYAGSDLQEKIRNYLIDAKRKWGAGLYILLGGDINIIPARLVKATDTGDASSYPADRYYYTSNIWSMYKNNVFYSNDSLSIINILARIPVSNTQEVTNYANKIITYEKANGLGDLNYLKNNLYSDAYISDAYGYLSDFAMYSIKKIYVPNYVSTWINNKYICDNANCTGDPALYSGLCDGGDIELNRNNFLSCLNTGANLGVGKFHFIYQMDHGSAVGAGTSSKDKGQFINRSDMDNLTNGTSYQIWLSSCCNTANFAYDCFGKHYIMKQNGGGVAYIGNTDVGWSSEYGQLPYFLDALHTTTNHPSLGRYDIGSAFQNILKKGYSSDWRLHLLGDPEMQVWTNVPQTMTVTTSPTSLQVGQSSINVIISGLSLPTGETATICVQKGTEVYEKQTVTSNGTYTVPCKVDSVGTVYVTVTAHNYFPVEKTVSVTTVTTPDPVISTVNFVDNGTNSSVGNSNGKNDAGETVCLQVTLKNNGGNTANSLTATLSSTSSYISMITNSATVGSIAANGTATAQFVYKINKDAPEILSNTTNAVQLKLDIKDASNTVWTRTFNIDVFATDLQQRNKIISSTSGTNVTFNIELQNMGQAPSGGLTATLKANNVIVMK